MKTENWAYGNLAFEVEILKKKNRNSTQQINLIALHPDTKERLKKKDLSDTNVQQTYKVHLTGKSVQDIRKNIFPDAAKKLIQLMNDRGFVTDKATYNDLYDLATEYIPDFIATNAPACHWNEQTQASYKNQMEYVRALLHDVSPSEMTSEDYYNIQLNIMRDAAKTSKKHQDWKEGDTPPRSGETRTRLFYLFCWYLLYSGLCDFSFVPTLYGKEKDHRDDLLFRLARVRSFPDCIIAGIQKLFGEEYPMQLLLACGLRLREACGLLWGNISVMSTSQGPVYLLHITGQLNVDGYYIDRGKTLAAHRSIAIPTWLGKKIAEKRAELEDLMGENLTYQPMCGYVENGHYFSSPEYRRTYVRNWEKNISDYLRQKENAELVRCEYKKNLIPVDEKQKITYEQCLYDSLTAHALRRHYNTSLYAHGGLTVKNIYSEMGHSARHLEALSISCGLTPQEEKQLALKHLQNEPGFIMAYDADGDISQCEVNTCEMTLRIPAGHTAILNVTPQEPWPVLELDVPDTAELQSQSTTPLPNFYYQDTLLYAKHLDLTPTVDDEYFLTGWEYAENPDDIVHTDALECKGDIVNTEDWEDTADSDYIKDWDDTEDWNSENAAATEVHN